MSRHRREAHVRTLTALNAEPRSVGGRTGATSSEPKARAVAGLIASHSFAVAQQWLQRYGPVRA